MKLSNRIQSILLLLICLVVMIPAQAADQQDIEVYSAIVCLDANIRTGNAKQIIRWGDYLEHVRKKHQVLDYEYNQYYLRYTHSINDDDDFQRVAWDCEQRGYRIVP